VTIDCKNKVVPALDVKKKPCECHNMTIAQNPFNPSPTLPTLAAIQRRRRELLALHAARQAAQLTYPGVPSDESLPTEESYPEEQSSLIHDEENEEQQQELQDPYSTGEPEQHPGRARTMERPL
jgi:hypothetical protein